ncbi:MAG: type II toxin-antitoxin system Phd/YefM family antitoxin [Pseudobutyrivibrio sp.]|nr:type II toxin-antitoxin system Phd/YefM family antitoxin [Pseudobutyrivibrio sp.]
MANVMSAINNTVSISQFNKGLAGKIFEEVKQFGAKVVMKNNTAECVLMSPEEYTELMDELCDLRLMILAEQRLANHNPKNDVSFDEILAEEGITKEEIEAMEDVEIE